MASVAIETEEARTCWGTMWIARGHRAASNRETGPRKHENPALGRVGRTSGAVLERAIGIEGRARVSSFEGSWNLLRRPALTLQSVVRENDAGL